ncbi:MAG: DUF2752 domain-containing protein [Bacteroidetes bacterium]|nr:DUF2752 domain-containing protein [Bacteroidota bacterium]
MSKAPPYVTISLVFFILIGVGFTYSYFFYPNRHPVDCAIKAVTGKDCPSCGFSRAFGNYTHLQFSEGKKFNTLSWHFFLFFLFQFFLRGAIILIYFIKPQLIRPRYVKTEVLVSILLFLFATLPILLTIKT